MKSYRFADFNAAWGWMTRVALKADAMDHHPEWSNVYNRVEVLLTTHDADGVTEKRRGPGPASWTPRPDRVQYGSDARTGVDSMAGRLEGKAALVTGGGAGPGRGHGPPLRRGGRHG